MNHPASLEEFVKQASHLQGDQKTLYVNQSDYTPEEVIVSDEDTAGGVNMQMIRFLASANSDAVYWEEPFYDSGELEQLNIQLDSLSSFTREVITLQEMEKTKSHFGLKRDSIQDENEPS
ncbi:hypothetical protein DVB69_04855 [Sporosarcina sp. BI001-red]|uniref:hypothetical protein n=1 Tax=Sporosarcina sp. BI001-red TaxID=2282866 RepID=UPI000E23D727|nr:hypothetical protein [Sporosarcina sp. BI001-red]REB10137.1 hypothetical protein DVB69_04855 [Sporosarcina sp. BI001-red]